MQRYAQRRSFGRVSARTRGSVEGCHPGVPRCDGGERVAGRGGHGAPCAELAALVRLRQLARRPGRVARVLRAGPDPPDGARLREALRDRRACSGGAPCSGGSGKCMQRRAAREALARGREVEPSAGDKEGALRGERGREVQGAGYSEGPREVRARRARTPFSAHDGPGALRPRLRGRGDVARGPRADHRPFRGYRRQELLPPDSAELARQQVHRGTRGNQVPGALRLRDQARGDELHNCEGASAEVHRQDRDDHGRLVLWERGEA
mmetsp:Transcript_93782/g.270984  ORF Transcript_93782/g.270984 Transcript_93782/m.270984 type:complete len:266 (+) Transcript_93782:1886-2683(+)